MNIIVIVCIVLLIGIAIGRKSSEKKDKTPTAEQGYKYASATNKSIPQNIQELSAANPQIPKTTGIKNQTINIDNIIIDEEQEEAFEQLEYNDDNYWLYSKVSGNPIIMV